ncbi:hypothetical protein D3C72_1842040 [compost metagenome]
MPVVMQACFPVQILPLKSDRITDSRCAGGIADSFFRRAPRVVVRAPNNIALRVGQFLRRAQVVAVIPGHGVHRVRVGRGCP